MRHDNDGQGTPTLVLRGRQLVSLLEMLEFQALRFVQLMSGITRTVEQIDAAINLQEPQGQDFTVPLRGRAGPTLDEIRSHCEWLGLDSGTAQIDRIDGLMARECSARELQAAFSELRSRIEDQLSSRVFMFMPMDKTRYYRDPSPFGPVVARRFSKCVFDMEEAAKCFAVGRWTAVVFHLMRIMEFGVKRIASKLGVTVDPRDTWGRILNKIDQAIQAMPVNTTKEKARQELFRRLSASLHAVKEAWRNPTMHDFKVTYTEDESLRIFNSVDSFMRSLAEVR